MSPTFRALRNPNYRLYLAGSVVSNTGTWMMRVAQDWIVLRPLHGGGSAVGVTTALQFLPALLLTPYAGILADRVPKRRLLQASQTTMGLFSLLSAAIALTGHSQLWLVYVCAIGLGVGAAFDAPTRQSFVSEMVPHDDLTNAVGLNAASFNVARLMGPALAGLIIGALGSGQRACGAVFAVNAVSYLAVIVQLQRMNPALFHGTRRLARGPHQLREAVAYVRGQPTMMFVLVLAFFASAFGLNFQLTSAVMATQVFGKGAGEFGLLGSVLAIGSLAGALMAARRQVIRLRLLVFAGLAFGTAEIVAGAAPSYTFFALVAPVIGFCAITMLNSSNATMQLAAADEMRGRVMALYMTVFQGATPIGSPIIGWIASHVGARWSLWVGGGLTILGVLLAVALLEHRRRRAGAAEPGTQSATATRRHSRSTSWRVSNVVVERAETITPIDSSSSPSANAVTSAGSSAARSQ